MDRVLSGPEMKACDNFTIEKFKVPSEVLMGRAADALCCSVFSACEKLGFGLSARILIFCGPGNNGGDGYAAATRLKEKGFNNVITCFLGDSEKMTDGCKREGGNALLSGIAQEELSGINASDFDLIIDAIFGIGLTRQLSGDFYEAVRKINASGAYVISADIASGVCSDTGRILGISVKADETVSFAVAKRGHLLYPGREMTGKLTVADIGIGTEGIDCEGGEKKDLYKVFTSFGKFPYKLPKRSPDSNKGTYGRVLIIGGAVNMAGAAFLSAYAAYRTGAGLVKIFSPEENRIIFQTLLPEAVLVTYKLDSDFDAEAKERLRGAIESSDVVVVGPGLSMSDTARRILERVLYLTRVPVVVDADALNLIASDKELFSYVKPNSVFTPHMAEMSRLTGESIEHLKREAVDSVRNFAKEKGIVCVMKDATTAVSDGTQVYLNQTGDSGMSKGGSGDVLSGIIGGLLAQKMNLFEAACTGVYLHGLAGDICTGRLSEYSLLAHDIADAIPEAVKETQL